MHRVGGRRKVVNVKGFTLIELMIVVAIIGILAAIAYPSYTQYVIKSNRENAKTELMDIANQMSMYKGVNHSFAGATVTQLYGVAVTPRQGTALYNLAFSPSPTEATGWTLVAQPIATSQQKGDGWICLNELGQRFWSKGGSSCDELSATSSWDNQ